MYYCNSVPRPASSMMTGDVSLMYVCGGCGVVIWNLSDRGSLLDDDDDDDDVVRFDFIRLDWLNVLILENWGLETKEWEVMMRIVRLFVMRVRL